MSNPTGEKYLGRLSNLKKALCILDCLYDGLTEAEIVNKCNGDGESVRIWLRFLKENQWITKEKINNRWVLTNKGAERMILYYKI